MEVVLGPGPDILHFIERRVQFWLFRTLRPLGRRQCGDHTTNTLYINRNRHQFNVISSETNDDDYGHSDDETIGRGGYSFLHTY